MMIHKMQRLKMIKNKITDRGPPIPLLFIFISKLSHKPNDFCSQSFEKMDVLPLFFL